MLWVEVIFALFFAVVIGLIVFGVFRYAGPWEGFFWVFLLAFLGTWAFGVWLNPIGPVGWGGVSWLPFLIAALVIVLLLAATTPVDRRLRSNPIRSTVPKNEQDHVSPAAGLIVLFWFLVIIFMIAIVSRYTWFA